MSFSKPKLLYFVTVDWFFCSHFFARAMAARDAGYEVVVLTNVTCHGRAIESAGLRLLPLAIDRRSMNPVSALRALGHIMSAYKCERPTLVHHVALKPILLGSLAARITGVPNVVNAVVGGGYALTSEQPLIRALRPFLKAALRAFINPPRSRVVFENADDLESFVRAGQVRREEAALIRGAGVEPELYQPGDHAVQPPLIVLAARLLWDKGIGEYVEAAQILKARGIRARLAVVGDIDPENRACIDRDTLARWRQEGFVELWGFQKDMPSVLTQASIGCLPSYREGLPKFLLEAMAASLPCVTTDVPGCRETIRDGDNGLLVPARDAQALANALQKLLLDPMLRARMGLRGRQRVEQEFSDDLITRQTLHLYNELISH